MCLSLSLCVCVLCCFTSPIRRFFLHSRTLSDLFRTGGLPTLQQESPDKGRNASVLLREFEERFARLSALDRTILDTSQVLLFGKSVNERDREQVGLLLETEDGLTTNWAAVKRVCGRFHKRREWADNGATGALNSNDGRGDMKRLMEEAAARHAETVHYSALAGIRVGAARPGRRAKPGSGRRCWKASPMPG